MRTKLLRLLFLVTAILLISVPAGAVLTSDNTNIGQHPVYGSNYSAFWRTGYDYTLLNDGAYTYLNTVSAAGAIMFRRGNSCGNGRCVTSPDGGQSMAYIDQNSNFNTGGEVKGLFMTATQSASQSLFVGGLVVSGTNSIINISGSGGQAYKPGGGSWLATSDIRTKKNETAYTAGLSSLRQIHPVVYSYNGLGGMPNDDHRYVGVNAQDIERVEASMVSSRRGKLRPDDASETDIKQVDSSALTYMLINAVQELDAKVKRLEAQRCK